MTWKHFLHLWLMFLVLNQSLIHLYCVFLPGDFRLQLSLDVVLQNKCSFKSHPALVMHDRMYLVDRWVFSPWSSPGLSHLYVCLKILLICWCSHLQTPQHSTQTGITVLHMPHHLCLVFLGEGHSYNSVSFQCCDILKEINLNFSRIYYFIWTRDY